MKLEFVVRKYQRPTFVERTIHGGDIFITSDVEAVSTQEFKSSVAVKYHGYYGRNARILHNLCWRAQMSGYWDNYLLTSSSNFRNWFSKSDGPISRRLPRSGKHCRLSPTSPRHRTFIFASWLQERSLYIDQPTLSNEIFFCCESKTLSITFWDWFNILASVNILFLQTCIMLGDGGFYIRLRNVTIVG
jgi:hypothetical protein